ncbi:hypothetical protein BD779DRAFT_1675791 [Infundibulicybe gibba]|nr:hypothetical protein BD779DRAFT_1675791 [Infundibulicybe gibba]
MRFQSLFLALASICTITRALPLVSPCFILSLFVPFIVPQDSVAVAVNREVGAGDILLTREADVDVRAAAADRNVSWRRTAVAAATWRRVAAEAGTVSWKRAAEADADPMVASWKRSAEAEAGPVTPRPWRSAAEAVAEPMVASWKRSAEADAETRN